MTDVRFYSCVTFRRPLEGDLLTCADCGWFAGDHDDRVVPITGFEVAHLMLDDPVGSTAEEASARRAARSPEYRAKRAERETVPHEARVKIAIDIVRETHREALDRLAQYDGTGADDGA